MWTPKPIWAGQEAYIIGGGASLVGFDFNQLVCKNTIGCNDAYRLGSEVVKVVLFSDAAWFQKNKFALEQFSGLVVSCAPTLLAISVPWLKTMARINDGIHSGPTLGWNFSTGAAGINLALSLGATSIYLLGMDLSQDGGKTHWHQHRHKLTSEDSFVRFRRGFLTAYRSLAPLIKEGRVRVVNVTNGSSKLPGFEKQSYAEVFETLQEKTQDRFRAISNHRTLDHSAPHRENDAYPSMHATTREQMA